MSAPPPLTGDAWLIALYHYIPNKPIAFVALALYLTLGAACAFITWRSYNKHARYVWILPVCCAIEALGYGMRVQTVVGAASAPLGVYMIQTLALLMPPIALAVIDYKVVARLVVATGQPIYRLRPEIISRFFLIGDIACFVVQGAGGGILGGVASSSDPEATLALGMGVALTGMVAQLVLFAFFTACVVKLMLDKSRRQALASCAALNRRPAQVRTIFVLLLSTIALLYTRAIYRTIEFSQLKNPSSPAVNQEWLFYLLETACVLAAVAVWTVWHFGRYVPAEEELVPGASVAGGSGGGHASFTVHPRHALANEGGSSKPTGSGVAGVRQVSP